MVRIPLPRPAPGAPGDRVGKMTLEGADDENWVNFISHADGNRFNPEGPFNFPPSPAAHTRQQCDLLHTHRQQKVKGGRRRVYISREF